MNKNVMRESKRVRERNREIVIMKISLGYEKNFPFFLFLTFKLTKKDKRKLLTYFQHISHL